MDTNTCHTIESEALLSCLVERKVLQKCIIMCCIDNALENKVKKYKNIYFYKIVKLDKKKCIEQPLFMKLL